MKQVLLDIDGVMVKAIPHKSPEFEDDGFYKFEDSAIIMLDFMLDDDDEIVLTTSHKFKYSLEEWNNIFKRRGIDNKIRIMDTPLDSSLSRKDEIIKWLEIHKPNYYIIIDDDKSLNGLNSSMKKNLILTDPYYGLTYSSSY